MPAEDAPPPAKRARSLGGAAPSWVLWAARLQATPEERVGLLGQRGGERVLVVGGLVAVLPDGDVGQGQRRAGHGGRGPGDGGGGLAGPAGLRRLGGGEESPRRPDQGPDADAGRLRLVEGLDG